MRRIVITGPQPVDMLDLVGPLEVFKFAPEYEVAVASPEGTTDLQLNHGFKISDTVPFTNLAGQIDTLVVAGGPGANDELYDDHYLSHITELASRSRRIAGICTGAFVLAAAGLLDGKRAVTHWAYCDKLSRQYPSVVVEPDQIYLRDGSIYTSAGITAGMDLALALVEEDHGHQVALEIARILVMFLVRPGGQSQYSHMLSRQAATSQPLRELQVWMIENLRENLSVERLAKRMGMSPRNFTRVCLRETRMNPGQFVDRMRVEAAQQMIDSSAMGLKEITDACGFQTPLAMRRTFLHDLSERHGDQIKLFALDVTDESATASAVKAAIGAFGSLEVVINNAGYGNLSSVEDTPMSDFRAQIETNLFGTIIVTKAALPYFRQRKAGHFVQFSSMGGRIGPPGRGPYSAAKWGVEGFSEVLSREVAPLGIKVTIVEPGGFRTDFAGSSTKLSEGNPDYDSTVGATAKFQRDYNGKQPGDPKKAAQAIVRLTQEQKPPLRLLLGSDAYNGAEKNDLARLEEARSWKELSRSTDFESRPPHPERPK